MKPNQANAYTTNSGQEDMAVLEGVIREAGELALKFFRRDFNH